jgi:hypothetical protein
MVIHSSVKLFFHLARPPSTGKVIMTVPRISASLSALLIAAAALLAAPTLSHANDFEVPFGAKVSMQASSGHLVATAEDFARVTPASLAPHEGGSGLGGDIAWHPTQRVGGDDNHGWRHHDDDGEDDDGHGGKTAVPEPSTALLLFSGISVLAGLRSRRHAASTKA